MLGALWPGGFHWLLPREIVPQLNTLAQLGVVLFVFLAGLEMNTRLLRRRADAAVVVSHVGIAVPFLFGVALALALYAGFAPSQVGFVPFALFLGVSMSVTALPVLVRILMDKGMLRSTVGTIALTCAVIDDVTAWFLLAVVVALAGASSPVGVVVVVGWTAGFAAFAMLALRPLLLRLISSAGRDRVPTAAAGMLVGLLLSALVSDSIGVHPMFGAFIFGLACPRENSVLNHVRERLGGLTTVLLLPLFFTYSGLRTDLSLLGSDPRLWLVCGCIVILAVAGKLLGSAVAVRAVGLSWRESLQVGTLMNCRGLTELVILNVGLDLGVLTPTLFTMMVVMALTTTVMTAPLLRCFIHWPRQRRARCRRARCR